MYNVLHKRYTRTICNIVFLPCIMSVMATMPDNSEIQNGNGSIFGTNMRNKLRNLDCQITETFNGLQNISQNFVFST